MRGKWLVVVWVALVLGLSACGPPKKAWLRFSGGPDEALVTINDEYVGKLQSVVKRGVRQPPGQYRITVEQEGYFPHDVIVTVAEEGTPPIVKVELVPIPD